jgi:hypothetical protein
MKRFRSFAAGLTACLLLSGCQSVYLHDEGLKTSTAKAHEALAGVAPLKPFDDQLANLEAFAQREDLAVAEYWTGVRDKDFTSLLAHPEDKRPGILRGLIDDRLHRLLKPQFVSNKDVLKELATFGGRRERNLEEQAGFERKAESGRRDYLQLWAEQEREREERAGRKTAGKERTKKANPKPDLSCEKMLSGLVGDDAVKAEINRLKASGSPFDFASAGIILNCHSAAKEAAEAAALIAKLKAWGGSDLVDEAQASQEAEAETEIKLSTFAADIEQKIKDAEKFDKEGSAESQLLKARGEIKGLLENASAATQLAGWEKAGEVIDALIRAEVCDAPDDAVDEATRTGAECSKIEAPTTTGRSQALWAMAKALAQLQDANAETRRDVNWLLAAKAIVAAEKADAQLRLAEKKAVAATARQRLGALVSEAAALAEASAWLPVGRESELVHAASCRFGISDPGPGNYNCAFAAYADSWNRGRLRGEVLRFRTVQIEREFPVRRSRATAEKQHALALAAAATLKSYGEGGIMPETIAQTLLDLGTIGVIRLED